MTSDPLDDVRALAGSGLLAGSAEYQRAILRVLLALLDERREARAPTKRSR